MNVLTFRKMLLNEPVFPQPTNTWCYKTMNRWKDSKCSKIIDLKVTRNEKLIDTISDLTLSQPLKNYYLSNFSVVAENIHNPL